MPSHVVHDRVAHDYLKDAPKHRDLVSFARESGVGVTVEGCEDLFVEGVPVPHIGSVVHPCPCLPLDEVKACYCCWP